MSPKPKPTNKTWATEVLRQDHDRITDLISDFDDPAEKDMRAEILDLAIAEIRVHRALVEELLLPAVREASGDPAALSEVEEELAGWEALLEKVEHEGLKGVGFGNAWRALTAEFKRHMDRGHADLESLAKSMPLDYVKLGLRMEELRRQVMASRPTASQDTGN